MNNFKRLLTNTSSMFTIADTPLKKWTTILTGGLIISGTMYGAYKTFHCLSKNSYARENIIGSTLSFGITGMLFGIGALTGNTVLTELIPRFIHNVQGTTQTFKIIKHTMVYLPPIVFGSSAAFVFMSLGSLCLYLTISDCIRIYKQ